MRNAYSAGNRRYTEGGALAGHASLQSTEVYLRADPTEKLEAMASVVPPTVRRGHFRPPDKLLAMLRSK